MNPRDSKHRIPYWIRYGLTAGVLMAITGALVVIVLPARYVLVADLRESGMSFPTTSDALAFPMPTQGELIQPPPQSEAPSVIRPGPAELLWHELDPALAAGNYREAIRLMDEYLRDRPGDASIRRERARTLALAGDLEEARDAFASIVEQTGTRDDRLALARLMRDLGDEEGAEALYRELLNERPSDATLRHELARLYMWAERYDEADALLRDLWSENPDERVLQLELARVNYWNDQPAEALRVLLGFPEDAPESAAADSLRSLLVELLRPAPEPEPEPETDLERARRLVAEADLEAAGSLYAALVAESPSDRALALERIDFLQYQVEDFDAAIQATEEYLTRFGSDPDLSYRLAEMYVWTDQATEARQVLESLVRRHPDRADAWSLLGDVHRYADNRGDARKAYERALAVQADDSRARDGISELDRLKALRIAGREPVGLGPAVSVFTDSDDFLLRDLGGSTGWIASNYAMEISAQHRRIEGLDLAGLPADDEGFNLGLEASRWWSEASLRTALRVGVDHLDQLGSEPTFGVSVEKFDQRGGSLSFRYNHSPAYPLTATLESAAADVIADHVEVAGTKPVGDDWALAGSLDYARLSGGGTANTRLGAGTTVSRRLGGLFRVELGSRVVGFSDPAPIIGRRLYWDPSLFWSNTVGLSLANVPEAGLGYRARAIGGMAWSNERIAADARWVPQLGVDAGLTWTSERTVLDLGAFYRRSRENEYSSFGLDLTLRMRP